MLPPQARVDQEAVAVKGYSTFPKAPASLEPHHQIVSWTLVEVGVLSFCRDAVGVFCSPNQLGYPLNGKPLKSVDHFIYLSSNILSTECNVNICIGKAWTVIDRLMIIRKSELSDKIKLEFSQVIAVWVLLYGYTTLKC